MPFSRIILIVLLCVTFHCFSQKKDTNHLIGLNYGQANQHNFIFNDDDYFYKNSYLKFQWNYIFSKKRRWDFELTIEPSIYFVTYQLLNKYFITPDIPNYIELQERYTQIRHFQEYALNIGILARYKLYKNLSTYIQGSIGPMISGDDTERLKKGFAFSDIVGIGFSYQQQKLRFDFRFTIRHNSNLDFAFPNSGHNSAGIETGVSLFL
jgi:hypothetical protein